jgi:subtilisin family serine protease
MPEVKMQKSEKTKQGGAVQIWSRLTSSFCALALSLGLALPVRAADVDPLILNQLDATGRADVFVKMKARADLATAAAIEDRNTRLWSVYDRLTAEAGRSQSAIRNFLRAKGRDFTVFWINNSLFVRGADQALVDALASFDGVAYLRGNHQVPLVEPVEVSPASEVQAIGWNIAMVRAHDFWAASGHNGDGIVVANIDTGVRWTHQALINQYRGVVDGTHNYNWWDPSQVCGPPLSPPCDNDDHGTHTMGTMVGDDGGANQIGMAPGAKWIAAKGCESNFCSNFALTSSAQWIACPTDREGNNPDCSKAPDVVNNSWSGGGGDPWYRTFVDSWLAAGIAPVFAAGNSGPSCNTVGSPGDYANTVGVASVTQSDVLSSFSSRGPSTLAGRAQPDISAPGSSVRSSTAASDTSYANFSGTSMAAPHVAGAIALMKSAVPSAQLLPMFLRMTRNSCQSTLGAPTGATSCGGVMWNNFPSNHYGWGRLDMMAIFDPAGEVPCQ